MKKTVRLVLIGFGAMLLFMQCKDPVCNSTIVFCNDSQDSVYVIPSFQYPNIDTFYTKIAARHKVYEGECNTWALSQSYCYQDIIPGLSIDTMLIFVVDAQIQDQEDSISVLKRYLFSLADLERSNFSISYTAD